MTALRVFFRCLHLITLISLPLGGEDQVGTYKQEALYTDAYELAVSCVRVSIALPLTSR